MNQYRIATVLGEGYRFRTVKAWRATRILCGVLLAAFGIAAIEVSAVAFFYQSPFSLDVLALGGGFIGGGFLLMPRSAIRARCVSVSILLVGLYSLWISALSTRLSRQEKDLISARQDRVMLREIEHYRNMEQQMAQEAKKFRHFTMSFAASIGVFALLLSFKLWTLPPQRFREAPDFSALLSSTKGSLSKLRLPPRYFRAREMRRKEAREKVHDKIESIWKRQEEKANPS